MERFILYSNHLLSMENNYTEFFGVDKKKNAILHVLIFERVSNRGKSCGSSFSRSYIIFVLTSGIFQNDKW